VTNVLNENFEDAKVLFLSPLMAIHYAHLVMLTAQRIVSREDATPYARRSTRSPSRMSAGSPTTALTRICSATSKVW